MLFLIIAKKSFIKISSAHFKDFLYKLLAVSDLLILVEDSKAISPSSTCSETQ